MIATLSKNLKSLNKTLYAHSNNDMTVEESLMLFDAIDKLEELLSSLKRRS